MKIRLNEFSCRLHDAIENYYQYNPDTLMPLLMLALATRGHLIITTKEKKGAYLACSLHLDEIKNYDWVQLNEKLNKKVESLLNEGGQYLTCFFISKVIIIRSCFINLTTKCKCTN